MASGLVGKKVSHQKIKLAELQANPEALKAFVDDGEGKYVLTADVAGKDWGIGTIWKLVDDKEGPVLARIFDGTAPDGLRIIDEAATGKIATKTASLHVPAADVTERMASGITPGGSEIDQDVTPLVLDWVEAGWAPTKLSDVLKKAQEKLNAGKLSVEEAEQIHAQASRIFPVVLSYLEEKGEGKPQKLAAAHSVEAVLKSLASYKPKTLSWAKFASTFRALLEMSKKKEAGEVPPQFQKKDDKKPEGTPADKDTKPSDKKEKEPGKKLPPWLEKKDK